MGDALVLVVVDHGVAIHLQVRERPATDTAQAGTSLRVDPRVGPTLGPAVPRSGTFSW